MVLSAIPLFQDMNHISNSSRGGTGIFVKSNIDSMERLDRSTRKEIYESTWIEIPCLAAYIGTHSLTWLNFWSKWKIAHVLCPVRAKTFIYLAISI